MLRKFWAKLFGASEPAENFPLQDVQIYHQSRWSRPRMEDVILKVSEPIIVALTPEQRLQNEINRDSIIDGQGFEYLDSIFEVRDVRGKIVARAVTSVRIKARD
jgi:hypothetical protein